MHSIEADGATFQVTNHGTHVSVTERRGGTLRLRYPHWCGLDDLPEPVRAFVASGEAGRLEVDRTPRSPPDEPWHYG